MKIMVVAAIIGLATASPAAVAGESTVPFENALINPHDLSQKVMQSMAILVLSQGYRCDSISGARSRASRRAFLLHCNDSYYTYEIKDMGGRLIVLVK